MNCTQANQMSIAGYLMRKGINPAKSSGGNFWYCSPLRNENEPSFKVCRDKNFWFDFGLWTGGRLVDLVCKMYNVSVVGALLELSGITIGDPHPFAFVSHQQKDIQNESGIVIKHIRPLQNKALIQYLISRKIDAGLASIYCKEAYYTTNASDKQNFSIAFENDRHGFELRNKYYKCSSSPKGITTIPGKSNYAVNCFEGFIDFLSALTWFKTDQPACDTIVLNGVGFTDRFIDLMPGYTKINIYLDNDNAGKETAKRIQAIRPDADNRSMLLYPRHKDFNEFLIAAYAEQAMQVSK